MKRDGLPEEQRQMPDHDPSAGSGCMLAELLEQLLRERLSEEQRQMPDHHIRLAYSKPAELYETILRLLEELTAEPVQPASSEANAIKAAAWVDVAARRAVAANEA